MKKLLITPILDTIVLEKLFKYPKEKQFAVCLYISCSST